MYNSGIAERLQPAESEEEIHAKIANGVEVFHATQDILNRFSNVHIVPQHLNEGGNMTPNIDKAMEGVSNLIHSKIKKEVSQGVVSSSKLAAEATAQVSFLNIIR